MLRKSIGLNGLATTIITKMVIEIWLLSAASSKLFFFEEEKLRSLVEDIDTVILAADANNKIVILLSPKNFGGTRCACWVWALMQRVFSSI
jgi:hypothetical protein